MTADRPSSRDDGVVCEPCSAGAAGHVCEWPDVCACNVHDG